LSRTGEPFSESSFSPFIQIFCFHTLAHSFAQREDRKSCRFNHIHTLFIVTEGMGVDVLRKGSQGQSAPAVGPHRLRAVRSIDADVLRRKVASPITGHGRARVQIHNQRNVFGEQTVAGRSRAYPPWPCYS